MGGKQMNSQMTVRLQHSTATKFINTKHLVLKKILWLICMQTCTACDWLRGNWQLSFDSMLIGPPWHSQKCRTGSSAAQSSAREITTNHALLCKELLEMWNCRGGSAGTAESRLLKAKAKMFFLKVHTWAMTALIFQKELPDGSSALAVQAHALIVLLDHSWRVSVKMGD